MAFLDRKIDVLVQHTLGKSLAEAKLLGLAQSQKNDPNIKLIDSTWSQINHVATFTVEAYSHTIHGRVQITDDTVRLDTDNLPLLAWPVIWYINGQVKTRLVTALKS